MAIIEEEAVSEDPNNNNSSNKKKKDKRKVGLGSSDAATIRRVIQAAQKGRIEYLRRRKAESPNEPLRMGLATLDKATRQRIAAMGGAAVKASFDVSYYSRLGKKGGNTVLQRYSVQYFADLGKKGNARKKELKKKKKVKS